MKYTKLICGIDCSNKDCDNCLLRKDVETLMSDIPDKLANKIFPENKWENIGYLDYLRKTNWKEVG